MSSEEFVEKMKNIQSVLLEFLEEESDEESKYDQLYNIIVFICKIEQLLRHFKNEIQKHFS